MHISISRGDVILADLDPVFGHELGGTRPALVVQNNIGNSRSKTTIVAVIARKDRPSQPTHVAINVPDAMAHSVVLLEQIRTIDERRIAKKLCSIDAREMHMVDFALMASLGIAHSANTPTLMSLCRTCAQSFLDSGSFRLSQTGTDSDEKELCTICNVNTGYDFEVTRLY